MPTWNVKYQKDITIIGLEPHPEDKKNGAYDRILLSNLQNKTEYEILTKQLFYK